MRQNPEGLTIEGLGALLRHVAVLIAVTALHLGHVGWLRTLAGRMALSIAVAADHLARLGTFARYMALLTTVMAAAAATSTTLGTVTGEVTGFQPCQLLNSFLETVKWGNGVDAELTLATLATFNTFSRAGLRA